MLRSYWRKICDNFSLFSTHNFTKIPSLTFVILSVANFSDCLQWIRHNHKSMTNMWTHNCFKIKPFYNFLFTCLYTCEFDLKIKKTCAHVSPQAKLFPSFHPFSYFTFFIFHFHAFYFCNMHIFFFISILYSFLSSTAALS